MTVRNTKLAVLGGGPAGYVAAIRAAQLGADVVLIEEAKVGGVCLHAGCIPTKALLRTSEAAGTVKKSKELGIESKIESIHWDTARNRKDRVVKNLNTGVEHLLNTDRITVLKGRGTVVSKSKIMVATAEEEIEVQCEKLILATGAEPVMPLIPGIESRGVLTSKEALELESLPESILIIGAGVIGLEFASMLNPLGVKVTVIEEKDRILSDTDQEMAAELLKIMKRQGISFKLSAKVTKIQETEFGLEVQYDSGDKSITQSCQNVLIAVGRRLRTGMFSSLSLQIENGAVVTNETMETSIKGVYAAGDITGNQLLAHLSFMEGRTAAENALGFEHSMDYTAVPSCIYTSPEAASVGMTEEEASAAGIQISVGRFYFRNNGRALTLLEREGFVKIIANEKHEIIGGQILGNNASELISELTLAIRCRATAEILADVIHPHPSLSEAIWEACGEIAGKAIHK